MQSVIQDDRRDNTFEYIDLTMIIPLPHTMWFFKFFFV